jgi:phage terminase small subunit
LIKELEDIAIMSAKERMVYLTNLLLDNEIDTNAKLKAMDILNKMSGEYTTKIEGNIGVTKLEDLL